MIEKVILDYLNDNGTAPAYMEVPETDIPDEFIVIEKTGSSPINVSMTASEFAIQSYALSMYDAAVLNESVKALVKDLPTLDVITRAQVESDYNFTDTETKRYRYQLVLAVTHYE